MVNACINLDLSYLPQNLSQDLYTMNKTNFKKKSCFQRNEIFFPRKMIKNGKPKFKERVWWSNKTR